MTLRPARSNLKLRLTTAEEIESASAIVSARQQEWYEIGERIRQMEAEYPSLCGLPGPGEEEMPEGLRGVYAAQTARYDVLTRFLAMEYPSALQVSLQRQQETRVKAGELIRADSVGIWISQTLAAAKMYIPNTHVGRFEERATEIYADFLRANPGAVLAKVGAQREEDDEN